MCRVSDVYDETLYECSALLDGSYAGHTLQNEKGARFQASQRMIPYMKLLFLVFGKGRRGD
jgi:hypothetical protein